MRSSENDCLDFSLEPFIYLLAPHYQIKRSTWNFFMSTFARIFGLNEGNMKTLVYFASGEYKQVYEGLPYERVYLVDKYMFRNQSNLKVRRYAKKSKVIMMNMDALVAIDFFRENGIMIDCMVCINEGLCEGGGEYVINEDSFMGYAMPVLSQEYIHVMNTKYYLYKRTAAMDFPYLKEDLFPGDPDYIDPKQFSDYHNVNHKHSKVYRMMRKPTVIQRVTGLHGIDLHILNDSAWNHYNNLDRLYMRVVNPYISRFFKNKERVQLVNNGHSYKSLIIQAMCEGMGSIGITPVKKGDFNGLIDYLQTNNDGNRLDVFLFHMNSKDFKLRNSEN